MQSKYDEVLNLFNKGDEITPDGTVLRKIHGNFMDEFSQDGEKLIRQSEFKDSLPHYIEEFIEGTNKKDIFSFSNGKPGFYQEGLEELADGTTIAVKRLGFDFFDGKPSIYEEGCEDLEDGTRRIAKFLYFLNGKLSSYQEGYELLPDGTIKAAKWLDFLGGKPSSYHEGCEALLDGTVKVAKRLNFINGKWV